MMLTIICREITDEGTIFSMYVVKLVELGCSPIILSNLLLQDRGTMNKKVE